MLPSLFTSPANSAGGLAQVGVRDEEILEVHHAASIEIRIDLHGGINGCARKRGVDSQGLAGNDDEVHHHGCAGSQRNQPQRHAMDRGGSADFVCPLLQTGKLVAAIEIRLCRPYDAVPF